MIQKVLENSINKLLEDNETSKRLTDAGYEFVMKILHGKFYFQNMLNFMKIYKNLKKRISLNHFLRMFHNSN